MCFMMIYQHAKLQRFFIYLHFPANVLKGRYNAKGTVVRDNEFPGIEVFASQANGEYV